LHGSQRRFSLARTPMCEYGWSCGVGVSDDRVEAVDEGGVAAGFVVPAAALGVFGECFRVGALGGEYREHCGLGAEVGAVLADVGVGADALRGSSQAVAASQPGLDQRKLAPLAGGLR